MSTVYVGVGSNRKNPREQLRRAFHTLSTGEYTTVVQCSKIYRSQPWGTILKQPPFLNAVIKIYTTLSALGLLTYLQHIEHAQDRVRTDPGGPRTLDLDILLFDALTMKTPQLTIPHPLLHAREFVVYPLHDVAPHLPDIASLRSTLDPRGIRAVSP